ncbi:hypothetical protein V1478_016981 [Vespula squamosa]|uniref:Uncharacterized protein n=1 Tax=Vespula squamosa TaxID=30214 RepID=A0ABD1ZY41_VESSQ
MRKVIGIRKLLDKGCSEEDPPPFSGTRGDRTPEVIHRGIRDSCSLSSVDGPREPRRWVSTKAKVEGSECASENGLERACDAYQSEKKLAKGKKKEIELVVSGTGRVECSQPRLPTFINLYQLPSARFVLSPDNMPQAL